MNIIKKLISIIIAVLMSYSLLMTIILILAYQSSPGIDDIFPDGRSALHHAAGWNGSIKEMRRLLYWGADINRRGKLGRTPIFEAVECNNLDHVKFLVEQGADITVVDQNGQNILDYAEELETWQYHMEEMVEYLKSLGLKPEKELGN